MHGYFITDLQIKGVIILRQNISKTACSFDMFSQDNSIELLILNSCYNLFSISHWLSYLYNENEPNWIRDENVTFNGRLVPKQFFSASNYFLN